MNAKPRDTTPSAWNAQRSVLKRLGPVGRIRVAIDLSEAVRSIQLDGILARNPGWSHGEAVRYLVRKQHGIDLPRLD